MVLLYQENWICCLYCLFEPTTAIWLPMWLKHWKYTYSLGLTTNSPLFSISSSFIQVSVFFQLMTRKWNYVQVQDYWLAIQAGLIILNITESTIWWFMSKIKMVVFSVSHYHQASLVWQILPLFLCSVYPTPDDGDVTIYRGQQNVWLVVSRIQVTVLIVLKILKSDLFISNRILKSLFVFRWMKCVLK